ncbi:membrane integrity-associated transporter subunit PqiC [Serratia sp. UGAL515B_01]|uniref:membrane integrity-associated transporter subunit PqiC n=1 Tax=Serratia sp. UGAL515B_01 TaxID=2986763 RepID=UPI0029546694|nr:membrane integrity-associated transporter subunit PqiC [Serratia sp. UGAL515B_01]WON78894.1 membrane integrity-associated transporter subunit PqiC [Serratia sp. UGAL515B_01]
MKKWIPIVLVMLLSACGSTPSKTYYQLPALGTPSQVNGASVPRQLWLEHVSVADFLAQNGLVYQTSDVRFVTAQNNLWASPLDQQLQQTLVTNLGGALPGWVVSSQSMNSDQDVLNVTISGFHGRYDGKAIVQGEWVLNHQGHLIKRPFNIELKQDEDGYDALVRSLAQAWQKEAQEIANQAARL